MAEQNSGEEQYQKSLTVSWKEGIPAQMMLSVMEYYLIPFGLFLGATTQMIGFLVSIPDLTASIAQLMAVPVVRLSGSRLNFLVAASRLQAFLLIPVAALAIIVFPNRIIFLILLMVFFKVTGNWIATAWGSLVSDYLTPEKRGRYLGWRSRVAGIAGMVSLILGGFLLYSVKHISAGAAFFILFLAAALCRFISSRLMGRMEDIPLEDRPESQFTFIEFLKRFRESNFVKFVLYVASITFTTQLAAPYFSVFMLRDLQYDYLTYMIMVLSAAVAALIGFPIWGRHADMAGNARILKTTGFLIPFIPLIWVLNHHPLYIFMVQAVSGFLWSGFNLCATNFIYDAVTPAKRVRCLGYFNLINGGAIFAGAGLGGYLGERLPPLGDYTLLTLFLLSGFLRFAAYFLFSDKFAEVRSSARSVSSRDLFASVIGIRPLIETNKE